MAGELTLRVFTPDSILLDTQASYVRIPGADGSMGILPRHAAMVSALDIGLVHYRQGKEDHVLFEMADGMVAGEELRTLITGYDTEERDEKYATTYRSCRQVVRELEPLYESS